MPDTSSGSRVPLSRDDIKAEFGVSRRWLELAAHKGDGPPMLKITPRMVRYDRSEFLTCLQLKSTDVETRK